jgi:hypothetical protein
MLEEFENKRIIESVFPSYDQLYSPKVFQAENNETNESNCGCQ